MGSKASTFAAVCVASAALVFTPSANAVTVGLLDGFGVNQGSLTTWLGPLCNLPNVCQTIQYNNWIPDPTASGGVSALKVWVNTVTGERMVFGYSLGGGIVTIYLQQNAGDPISNVHFYTFGNPFVGRVSGDTPTRLTEVYHQYDPVADGPDGWNLLSWLNVLMSSRHCCYSPNDINDPNAVRWTDGNVDYVMVLTYPLPLIAWMDPASAAFWDAILRPIVENGYNRPVPDPTITTPPATTVATQEVTTWTEPTATVTVTSTTTTSKQSDTVSGVVKPKESGASRKVDSAGMSARPSPTSRASFGSSPRAQKLSHSSATKSTKADSAPKPKNTESKKPKKWKS